MIEAWRSRDGVDDAEPVALDALPATAPDAVVRIHCGRPAAGVLAHIADPMLILVFCLSLDAYFRRTAWL